MVVAGVENRDRRSFFTWEHVETVARRHAATPGGKPQAAVGRMVDFKMLFEIEGLHPLEGGALRRKRRRDRRPGLPREPALAFYPRHVLTTVVKVARYCWHLRRASTILRRIGRDPARFDYSDAAIARIDDEYDKLELFRETSGGTAMVAKVLRQEAVVAAVRAAGAPAG